MDDFLKKIAYFLHTLISFDEENKHFIQENICSMKLEMFRTAMKVPGLTLLM